MMPPSSRGVGTLTCDDVQQEPQLQPQLPSSRRRWGFQRRVWRVLGMVVVLLVLVVREAVVFATTNSSTAWSREPEGRKPPQLLPVPTVIPSTLSSSSTNTPTNTTKTTMTNNNTTATTHISLTVVQVGANDGSTSGNDRTVHRFLNRSETRAVLIEGNPPLLPRLRATLARRFPHTLHHLHPHHALICAHDATINNTDATSGGVVFYVVNVTRIKQDYPSAPHWVLYQIGSTNLGLLRGGLRSYLNDGPATRVRGGKSIADHGADWPDLGYDYGPEPRRPQDKYIAPLDVPCQSLGTILEQYHIPPSHIDVLAVDVEGMDTKIVTSALLSWPALEPAIILFEAKIVARINVARLITLLHQRGYETPSCHIANPNVTKILYDCPPDVYAFHRHGPSAARIRAVDPTLLPAAEEDEAA